MTKGKLILFPVPIGADELALSLPEGNLGILGTCHTFIVEELRTARRFLKKAGFPHPIDDTVFLELNEHTTHEEIGDYLDAAERGENIGLLSEAGLPCVADPGAMITKVAQRRGIEVVPLVGPSSLMLALMASGLNGQCFAFTGYLPVKAPARREAILTLERTSARLHQSQLIIETPYRNDALLADLLETCRPDTRLCIAANLTCPDELIRTHRIADWRPLVRQGFTIGKRPCVFVILSEAKDLKIKKQHD